MEGINSRLDGLQAAILSVKLPHLQRWTEKRRRVADHYNKKLNGLPGLKLPPVGPDRDHVYHLYVVRTQRRDELKGHLAAKEIATVINYPKALPFYPAYAYLNHKPEDFPAAHKNQGEILSLPIYPEMESSAIGYVAGAVAEFAGGAQAAG
jgi:dTDP-4-amino-4,6-dideoxygalactose transaminase